MSAEPTTPAEQIVQRFRDGQWTRTRDERGDLVWRLPERSLGFQAGALVGALGAHREELADLIEPHDVSYDDSLDEMLYCHTCDEPLSNTLLIDPATDRWASTGQDIERAERRHLIDLVLTYLRSGRTD